MLYHYYIILRYMYELFLICISYSDCNDNNNIISLLQWITTAWMRGGVTKEDFSAKYTPRGISVLEAGAE